MARIHWLDVLLAPLTWVERVRGRRRLALLGLYGLILGVGAVLVGREAVLWRLPAAPEPFDVARYGHVDLPDAENAMVAYRQAVSARVRDDRLWVELPPGAREQWDWATADPRVREWAGRNEAALDLWLRGTVRPDALLVQPAEQDFHRSQNLVFDLQELAHLGALEATRRQGVGDLAGAWAYHRGVIRSCLHAGRHAATMPVALGLRWIGLAKPLVQAWIDDPRQTPDLLRRAGADLARCRELAARLTPADLVRVEYFINRAAVANEDDYRHHDLDPTDPNVWFYHLPGTLWGWNFLRNEPKRSQHILRLLTAGCLAQADRPAASRPSVAVPRHLIYAVDPSTPPALARIKPADLGAWADASRCRVLDLDPGFGAGLARGLAAAVDTLHLHLARRGYALDHGGQAPQTGGDLVGPYLDALPAGIAPGDPLPPP